MNASINTSGYSLNRFKFHDANECSRELKSCECHREFLISLPYSVARAFFIRSCFLIFLIPPTLAIERQSNGKQRKEIIHDNSMLKCLVLVNFHRFTKQTRKKKKERKMKERRKRQKTFYPS
jgi:hypothetical protein